MNLRRLVRPEIKRFAKELRKRETRHEKLLWKRLRCRRLGGLRFRRQSILRGYIVDFYCPSKHLAVEVDGATHDKEKDRVRDARILRDCRITVLRFSNEDVEKRISQVIEKIARKCGIAKPSTNPQDSSLQDIHIERSCCGKGLTVENLRVCGKAGKPCPLQVFTTINVAENFVRSLKERGIESTVLRCLVCGMIHVRRQDG